MKRFAISLMAVVFLTIPVLAGEIDGSGRQDPPPPPPPTQPTSTTQGAPDDAWDLTDLILLAYSIRP